MPEPTRHIYRRSTLAASCEVTDEARKRLLKLGYTQEIFADFVALSRSTVNSFFNGKAIRVDNYKKICNALGLNWENCVSTEQPVETSTTNYCCTSTINQEEGTM